MKSFITDNFLLHSKSAERLYFDYAKDLPIIDFHNHLEPSELEANVRYRNLTQASLDNDQLKWRLLRMMGVDESLITGDADDMDKFLEWSRIMPSLIRHPMYHWAHLELKRLFGIDEVLDENSAAAIYHQASDMLGTAEMSIGQMLNKFNVAVICTPNDPADDLSIYRSLELDDTEMKILPTWRPEKLFEIEHTLAFNKYMDRLEEVAGHKIVSLDDLDEVIRKRHDEFASYGCVVADHYLDTFYSVKLKRTDIQSIFAHSRLHKPLTWDEVYAYRSYMLQRLATLNYEKGWVQQYHYGTLQNVNTRMYDSMGRKMGWDATGDTPVAQHLVGFLDGLDKHDHLARTIIYNLNPADNELISSITGSFSDGSMRGKVQMGSAWRYNNHRFGIEQQLNALSGTGLLSTMVATQTDAHSILSFTRHEYFRRILCNVLGSEMENGELPADFNHIGKIVQDVCYYNAREYFKF